MPAEEIFRNANDQIADMARKRSWRFPVPFLCECSDRRCLGRVELPLKEYEQVRSNPQRYIALPGHEVEGAVVLEETERVSYAEKLYGYRSA